MIRVISGLMHMKTSELFPQSKIIQQAMDDLLRGITYNSVTLILQRLVALLSSPSTR